MSSLGKVIVVTGGNRGLGFELVRRLGELFKDGSIYLTSRSGEAGVKAVDCLKLQGINPIYHKLDVTSFEDISELKEDLMKKHGSPSIDILVNNAGINLGGDKSVPIGKRVEDTIKVNYFGIVDVSKALYPLLKPGARVLNLASSLAKPARNQVSEQIRNRMDSKDLTIQELSDIMRSYVKYAKEGRHVEMGFCNHAYGVSKYGVIALTRILAKENTIPGVLINCCCPGWVRTDMGGPKALTSVEKGVETLLQCVLLPERKEPNGEFIVCGKVVQLG